MNERLPSPETSTQYEPTPEGLGMALDAAIERHADAIVHREADKGDLYGRTGGDQLILYTDPNNPRKSISISPVGLNAEDRRFPARLGFHINYEGKGEDGGGTYRVDGVPGNRSVWEWSQHPELPSAIAPSIPKTETFVSLITALSHASPEKPVGRSRKVLRALGTLSRRGTESEQ